MAALALRALPLACASRLRAFFPAPSVDAAGFGCSLGCAAAGGSPAYGIGLFAVVELLQIRKDLSNEEQAGLE